MSKGQTPGRHDWYARAAEALEKARKMKPGAERNEALKKAGQLQTAADIKGYLASKELRPPKGSACIAPRRSGKANGPSASGEHAEAAIRWFVSIGQSTQFIGLESFPTPVNFFLQPPTQRYRDCSVRNKPAPSGIIQPGGVVRFSGRAQAFPKWNRVV
jgi:hypothetical protein